MESNENDYNNFTEHLELSAITQVTCALQCTNVWKSAGCMNLYGTNTWIGSVA